MMRKGLPRWVGRVTALLLVFLAIFPASPLVSLSAVRASAGETWDGIGTIYYNPSQDDATNKFLQQAATELRDNIQKAGKTLSIIISSSMPASGSIYLEVDPALPDLANRNEEAFRLFSDAKGIYITGKTPLAVRHGAYALLEKLGFRWFFEQPAWWVTPSTLISLDGLNEVQEPFYTWRRPYIWSRLDSNAISDWAARNRLYGARDYSFDQNYYQIAAVNNYSGYGSLAAMYAARPDLFISPGHVPGGVSGWGPSGWELVPDNPGVVAMAKAYARKLLALATHETPFNNDLIPYGAIPISPNDREIWDASGDTKAGWQTITDKVYSLANEVAKDLQANFPGVDVTIMSASSYAGIPTFDLQPNIIAYVVTDFNETPLTLDQQIEGLTAKGIKVGIWDLYSEWPYFQDLPFLNLSKVRAITHYAQKGVKIYHSQTGGDAWGIMGLTSYAASKILWAPFQDCDAILTDFYSKAFGPAQGAIRRYYGRYEDTGRNVRFSYQKYMGWLPPQGFPVTVGEGFQDLAEAESLVAGNNVYLERIRQLEYYQRFLWLYHVKGITNLGLDDLKGFYTFVNRIRDLHVINYTFDEPAIRNELKRKGLTDPEINALQDFTPPTAAEATAWLNEALEAFPRKSLTLSPSPTSLPKAPSLTPTPTPSPAPPSPTPPAPPAKWPLIGWIAALVTVFGLFVFFLVRQRGY